ncbi:DNA-directed DNA polymerase [Tanacetum coccineum]
MLVIKICVLERKEEERITDLKKIRGKRSHKADECKQTNPVEQVCLSEGDIYDDPSLLRFYQNDDTPPWGNRICKEKGEDGPEWTFRSKFGDELTNFMLEKKSHAKGIGDMLDQHHKELHKQFFQILFTIKKSETPELEAPTFAITTRSGVSTQDPPSSTMINIEETKKDDEDERLLSILKQIHINLPFLEAMIHMPKGANVLKDILSHKEKLEKAASSVKLSEECSAIFQRSLPQKEGDPGSFTLPCLIGPLIVKNALADLGASINSCYTLNLLVKISKFIFPVDFVVLEMDEDELVPIILRRPFLATTRAVIDVHELKLSLRVGSETVTFNIGKSMKSKHSRDDYLYCADHIAKLVQEQWVDTIDHDGKWTEEEEEEDSNKALAVSFYPRTEPVEPLEWKALENRLKPSSFEPPKLILK